MRSAGFGAASPVRSIPPSPVPIFERSPYIELAFDPRQLKAIRRFIKLLPHALPPRYDPSAEDSRELAADRLLILSGFPDTPPLSPIEMRTNPAAAHAFRRNCLALNDLAAAICNR